MGDMIWFTDDESEELAAAIDTLDHLTISLTAMTTLPDSVHLEALRSELPKVRDSLKRVWRAVNDGMDDRGND